MRQLNGVDPQRSNLSHRRVGHVHLGRFKTIFVEREGYLLELARYITDAFGLHISTISRAIAPPRSSWALLASA